MGYQFVPESVKRHHQIAALRPFIGGNHRQPGGVMHQPDGGFNFVAVLAAGAPAPEKGHTRLRFDRVKIQRQGGLVSAQFTVARDPRGAGARRPGHRRYLK